MKRKIFISGIVFFTLHLFTWWVFGDEVLLKKGFKKLERNTVCNDQYYRLARTGFYQGEEYTYTSERIYINRIPRANDADSIKTIKINGIDRPVLGYRPDLLRELAKNSDATNTIYQLLIVHEEWIPSNPYFQDAMFTCWVLGSDIDEGYEPLLVWGIFGWIDISNKHLYRFYRKHYVKYRMEKERNN